MTVVTHEDVIKFQDKNEVKRKAMEVTGSSRGQTFLLANWLSEQEEYDERYERDALKMLRTALGCGERSVRARQIRRKLSKK